jgi:hypothetical protein
MMIAVVANTEAKRLGQHQCQSWEECHEWIDSFITWHGLTRKQGYVCEHGQMTVWVEERK